MYNDGYNEKYTFRDFKNIKHLQLKNNFQSINWSMIYELGNVND